MGVTIKVLKALLTIMGVTIKELKPLLTMMGVTPHFFNEGVADSLLVNRTIMVV